MSDFFVHRAMQIACMNDQQISELHKLEKNKGYCIPNWNIQELFNLSDIKTYHGIPDDMTALATHSGRIKRELLTIRTCDVVDSGKPWEAITSGNIENTHKADWNVYNAKEAGQINFLYQGGSGSKKGGLKSRVLANFGGE